jgi:hypothetical protein
MTCATMLLAAAIGQLPAGTCALACDVGPAIIGVETEARGKAMGRDGQLVTVHKVDGEWAIVLEQEPAMCARGARP